MAVHARVPSARGRAMQNAIGDETQSATSQALRGLSAVPKDSYGFDQNGIGENMATLERANETDALYNQQHPNDYQTRQAQMMESPGTKVLLQSLSERGARTRDEGGPGSLPLDEGVGTAANPLNGLDPNSRMPLARQLALRSLGMNFTGTSY